jgi:two-component system, cell cycle response regulator DivK
MSEEITNKLVLVVDDEKENLTYVGTLLEDNGYDVVTAGDGKEALEAARDKKPDLVVLDLMMPNQTGTDFYRNLSKEKELKNVPVIVVSGLAGRDLAVPEPVAVFDKPLDTDAFITAVDKVLS